MSLKPDLYSRNTYCNYIFKKIYATDSESVGLNVCHSVFKKFRITRVNPLVSLAETNLESRNAVPALEFANRLLKLWLSENFI